MADFKNLGEFTQNNDAYVAGFQSGGKPMPPARKALLITCMDGGSEISSPRWTCSSSGGAACRRRTVQAKLLALRMSASGQPLCTQHLHHRYALLL